jgi:hypothetical protein
VSRRLPPTSMQRCSYGAWSWNRIGLGGDLEIWVDSKFVNMVGLFSGNAKFDLAATSDSCDVRGAVIWVARATRHLGRPALRLMCDFYTK